MLINNGQTPVGPLCAAVPGGSERGLPSCSRRITEGVLTSVANFIPLFSLEVHGEQQLQEQGMFWEGHFGALWGEPLHWWRASGSNNEGAWPGQILLLIPWDLPLALARRAAPASSFLL